MCGRYALTRPEAARESLPFVDFHETRLEPRFNIAPSQLAPVIVDRDGADKPTAVMARWGFSPRWRAPGSGRPAPINARAETVADSPLFRDAFAHRRCLVLADGFYEWRREGKRTVQPYYFRLRDARPFAFAGLATPNADGELTFAFITTGPNALMEPVHNRMPVLLTGDALPFWLEASEAELPALRAVLAPYDSEAMTAYPVSPRVNSPRNDEPSLVDPAET